MLFVLFPALILLLTGKAVITDPTKYLQDIDMQFQGVLTDIGTSIEEYIADVQYFPGARHLPSPPLGNSITGENFFLANPQIGEVGITLGFAYCVNNESVVLGYRGQESQKLVGRNGSTDLCNGTFDTYPTKPYRCAPGYNPLVKSYYQLAMNNPGYAVLGVPYSSSNGERIDVTVAKTFWNPSGQSAVAALDLGFSNFVKVLTEKSTYNTETLTIENSNNCIIFIISDDELAFSFPPQLIYLLKENLDTKEKLLAKYEFSEQTCTDGDCQPLGETYFNALEFYKKTKQGLQCLRAGGNKTDCFSTISTDTWDYAMREVSPAVPGADWTIFLIQKPSKPRNSETTGIDLGSTLGIVFGIIFGVFLIVMLIALYIRQQRKNRFANGQINKGKQRQPSSSTAGESGEPLK